MSARIVHLLEADLVFAAKLLDVEVAAIKSVDAVESNGNGFLADGLPKILFERHWFYNLTDGKWKSNPDFCSPAPGGYAKGETAEVRGQREWLRFNRASSLDWNAAVQSASWGRYQIMGFNYRLCGFTSLREFYDAMMLNEAEQLKAFIGFIRSKKLDRALREKRWAAFARLYNGPSFRKNSYDTRLAEAYKKFA